MRCDYVFLYRLGLDFIGLHRDRIRAGITHDDEPYLLFVFGVFC